MIIISDTLLQRVTSTVLVLYVGTFLGQALCVLHSSHGEAGTSAGTDVVRVARASSHVPAVHALTANTLAADARATYAPTERAASSMATHGPTQHGGHSEDVGRNHSGACAVTACGSAITATSDHGLGPMSRISNTSVAYLGGMTSPITDQVPPPPRLG